MCGFFLIMSPAKQNGQTQPILITLQVLYSNKIICPSLERKENQYLISMKNLSEKIVKKKDIIC